MHYPSETSAIHSYPGAFSFFAWHATLFSLNTPSRYHSISSVAYPLNDYQHTILCIFFSLSILPHYFLLYILLPSITSLSISITPFLPDLFSLPRKWIYLLFPTFWHLLSYDYKPQLLHSHYFLSFPPQVQSCLRLPPYLNLPLHCFLWPSSIS